MSKYYNRNSLIKLLPEKFVVAFGNIIAGRSLYKTWDKRILDFELGTEERSYNSGGKDALHSSKSTKEAGHKVRHINRVNRRGNKRW